MCSPYHINKNVYIEKNDNLLDTRDRNIDLILLFVDTIELFNHTAAIFPGLSTGTG